MFAVLSVSLLLTVAVSTCVIGECIKASDVTVDVLLLFLWSNSLNIYRFAVRVRLTDDHWVAPLYQSDRFTDDAESLIYLASNLFLVTT